MLVGNIISVSGLSARFTTGSTGLNGKLFASGLKGIKTFLGPSREVDVDGGSYSLNTSGQSFEYTSYITSLLHGNDSELIFFIDPDKECFGFVVEDTTAFGPVTFHTGYLQVWISRHEEEVVINQLLSDSFIHTSQWVVVSSEVTSELSESSTHEFFNSNTLFLGDSGGKTESLDGSSNTNSDRMYWDIIGNVSLNFFDIHVGNVFESSWETVVFTDEGVEDISEVDVGVFITSIHTAMLVVEFNSAGNSLGQSESRGLGDNSGEFVPSFLGDVLSNQGVLGFDIWEFCHCNSFCFFWTD